jgi:hypothetical protein
VSGAVPGPATEVNLRPRLLGIAAAFLRRIDWI